MRPTAESIISFTADSTWTAHIDYAGGGESWEEPVIGFGIVVQSTDYSGAAPAGTIEDGGEIKTTLEPILLVEGRLPVTLNEHMSGLHAGTGGQGSWSTRYDVDLVRRH